MGFISSVSNLVAKIFACMVIVASVFAIVVAVSTFFVICGPLWWVTIAIVGKLAIVGVTEVMRSYDNFLAACTLAFVITRLVVTAGAILVWSFWESASETWMDWIQRS